MGLVRKLTFITVLPVNKRLQSTHIRLIQSNTLANAEISLEGFPLSSKNGCVAVAAVISFFSPMAARNCLSTVKKFLVSESP